MFIRKVDISRETRRLVSELLDAYDNGGKDYETMNRLLAFARLYLKKGFLLCPNCSRREGAPVLKPVSQFHAEKGWCR